MENENKPEKKVQDKLYKYANIVMHAKMDGSAKALLWFYAYVFNWEQRRPSFWPQRKICAMTGMAPSTYHKKRKYLEELGWITVFNRGFENSCLVSVKVGMNDPEYENMSWAKWHPENERKARQESLAQFLIDSAHVLENDDSSMEPSDAAINQEDSDRNWTDLEEAIW